jgi:hypothetical protein
MGLFLRAMKTVILTLLPIRATWSAQSMSVLAMPATGFLTLIIARACRLPPREGDASLCVPSDSPHQASRLDLHWCVIAKVIMMLLPTQVTFSAR